MQLLKRRTQENQMEIKKIKLKGNLEESIEHFKDLRDNSSVNELTFSIKECLLKQSSLDKIKQYINSCPFLKKLILKIGNNIFFSEKEFCDLSNSINSIDKIQVLIIKINSGNFIGSDDFQFLKQGFNKYSYLQELKLKLDFYSIQRVNLPNKAIGWFTNLNYLNSIQLYFSNMTSQTNIMSDLNQNFSHLQQLEYLKLKFKKCAFYESQGFEIISKQIRSLSNLKQFYLKFKESSYIKDTIQIQKDEFDIDDKIVKQFGRYQQFIYGLISGIKYLENMSQVTLKFDQEITKSIAQFLFPELLKLKNTTRLALQLSTSFQFKMGFYLSDLMNYIKHMNMITNLKLIEKNHINNIHLFNTITGLKDLKHLKRLSIKLLNFFDLQALSEVQIDQMREVLNSLQSFSIKSENKSHFNLQQKPRIIQIVDGIQSLKKVHFAYNFSQIGEQTGKVLQLNNTFGSSKLLKSVSIDLFEMTIPIKDNILFLNSFNCPEIQKFSLKTQKDFSLHEEFYNQLKNYFQQMINLKSLTIHIGFQQSSLYLQVFCQGIESLTNIQELDIKIYSKSFGQKQAIQFFENLSKLKTIKNLSLQIDDENQIYDQGTEGLSKALEELKELRSLKLIILYENLEPFNIRNIVQTICNKVRLKQLELEFEWDDIEQVDVIYLYKSIKKLFYLQDLTINIGSFLTTYLIKLFTDLPYLQKFDDLYCRGRVSKIGQQYNHYNNESIYIENNQKDDHFAKQQQTKILKLNLSFFYIQIQNDEQFDQFKQIINNMGIPSHLYLYLLTSDTQIEKYKRKIFKLFTDLGNITLLEFELCGFKRGIDQKIFKPLIFKSKRLVSYNIISS